MFREAFVPSAKITRLSENSGFRRSVSFSVEMVTVSCSNVTWKLTGPAFRYHTAWVAWSQNCFSSSVSIRNSCGVNTVILRFWWITMFFSSARGEVFAIKCSCSMGIFLLHTSGISLPNG